MSPKTIELINSRADLLEAARSVIKAMEDCLAAPPSQKCICESIYQIAVKQLKCAVEMAEAKEKENVESGRTYA